MTETTALTSHSAKTDGIKAGRSGHELADLVDTGKLTGSNGGSISGSKGLSLLSNLSPTAAQACTTGFPALDALLPWQGWPDRGLVEIISHEQGIGELQLLMPLLRHFSQSRENMLWITPPHQIYSPALAQAGVATDKLFIIQPQASCKHALWSIEKALQSNECSLVIAWQNWLSPRVIRRLQLAAQHGKTLGLLFHQRNIQHSPSTLRLQLKAVPTPPDGPQGDLFQRGLQVDVLKARGSHHRGSIQIHPDG